MMRLVWMGIWGWLGTMAWSAESEPASFMGVELTGWALSVQETTEIPRDLFGVHATRLSVDQAEEWGIESVRVIHVNPKPEPSLPYLPGAAPGTGRIHSVIDCFWDRYQPALQLSSPQTWREELARLARGYGERSARTGHRHVVEFWNEPYLNWATRPAVNYHEAFYEKEGRVEGGPMTIRGMKEPVAGLAWDRPRFVVLHPKGGVDYVRTSRIPAEGQEGETVKLLNMPGSVTLREGAEVDIRGPVRLRRDWFGKDTGQKHYWSGPVNSRFYDEMLSVFGPELKKADPNVVLLAGWGFNMFNKDWDPWETLYRPSIDRNHAWIDGLHEHHYGGDTRAVAASYEVAYAYAWGRYGKRLVFYNTEAGGSWDPEQPGGPSPVLKGDGWERARGALTYLVRDIVYMAAKVPDKAKARAAHEAEQSGGEELGFRLLKPLRGRLLESVSHRNGIWSVAAAEGNRVTLVVFNDGGRAVEVPLRLVAPQGTAWTSARMLRVVPPGPEAGGKGRLEEVAWDLPASGREGMVRVGPKAAVVLVMETAGPAVPDRLKVRSHYPCGEVLVRLETGKKNAGLSLPATALEGVEQAWVRVVAAPGSPLGTVRINGKAVVEGKAGDWIVDHPVPVGILREENGVEWDAGRGPVRIDALGLILETRVVPSGAKEH